MAAQVPALKLQSAASAFRQEALAPNWRPAPALAPASRFALVVLGHALLLLGWQAAMQRPVGSFSEVEPPGLVWLWKTPPNSTGGEVANTFVARPDAKPAAQVRLPANKHQNLPVYSRIRRPGQDEPTQMPDSTAKSDSAHADPEPATSATHSETAAVPGQSAPSTLRLLDSPASRAVMKEISRQALLSEKAASATGLAATTQAQRLAAAASSAAYGDCAKGQFFGSGGGLLSLPFLAKAVLAGECAR